jgi:hypothetical protein
VALVAAAVFFAGVLFGSAGRSEDPSPPQPVVLQVTDRPAGDGPGGQGRNAPAALDVEEVEHDVEEGDVEDYGDDQGGDGDNSGPGSGDETPEPDDNSGPGSVSSGSGSESPGPGSGSSGSGSSGSGGDGSGSGG